MATLSLEKRRLIESLLKEKITKKEAAIRVGVDRSTIHREIKKCKGAYNAEEAEENTSKGFHKIDFDIVGKKISHVTIMRFVCFNNKKLRRTVWECLCDCGETCYFSRKMLVEYCSPDRPLSCGCVAKETKGPCGPVPIEEAALRKYQDLLTFRKIRGKCWEWTGYRQKGKVPKTSWKNRSMSVRKCMYLLMNGITYECNPVFTTCGNLNCFNPEHITLIRPARRQYYQD